MRGEKFFYRRLSTREILASPHGIAAEVRCRDGRRLRIITLREGLAAEILISLFPCPAFGEGDGTDEAVLTPAFYGTWISKKKSLARGDVDVYERSEAALASFVEPWGEGGAARTRCPAGSPTLLAVFRCSRPMCHRGNHPARR